MEIPNIGRMLCPRSITAKANTRELKTSWLSSSELASAWWRQAGVVVAPGRGGAGFLLSNVEELLSKH